jgi:hypothetical protein
MGMRQDLPPLPSDIPKSPWEEYCVSGWSDINDWLGVSNVQMMKYTEAKQFVQKLGLRNWVMWQLYVGGKYKHLPRLPLNIPKHPNSFYHHRKAGGWISTSDWLGIRLGQTNDPMPFESARDFARSLKLPNSSEWIRYRNGERPDLPPLPEGLPDKPEVTYKKIGWVNYSDWLGLPVYAPTITPKPPLIHVNTTIAAPTPKDMMPKTCDENGYLCYEDAREIISVYRFRGKQSFYDFMQRNLEVPPFNGIPRRPQSYYHGKGWAGWRDWLKGA